jgi:hypothetical protein
VFWWPIGTAAAIAVVLYSSAQWAAHQLLTSAAYSSVASSQTRGPISSGARQLLVQHMRVHRRHHGVAATGDDLNRHADLGQQVMELQDRANSLRDRSAKTAPFGYSHRAIHRGANATPQARTFTEAAQTRWFKRASAASNDRLTFRGRHGRLSM